MRVMVLDSNAYERQCTCQMIKILLPFAIVNEYSNGIEAMEAAEKTPPDIFFTDVFCEGLDGLFLAKKLREKDLKVNIIFTTSLENNKRYALSFFKIQASACLEKPVKSEELDIAIQNIRYQVS